MGCGVTHDIRAGCRKDWIPGAPRLGVCGTGEMKQGVEEIGTPYRINSIVERRPGLIVVGGEVVGRWELEVGGENWRVP